MSATESWYAFYSNLKLVTLEKRLRELANSLGYQLEVSWFDNRQFFFFFEHEEMLHWHDQNGYRLSPDGKGCFCVELKPITLDARAVLEEVDGRSDFFVKTARVMLYDICYCFLTLPTLREASEFSSQIYEAVEKLLLGGEAGC